MPNIPNSPCVSFTIQAVTLPGIFTSSTVVPSLSFPPPPTLPEGLVPCCKFSVPTFSPSLPLPPLPIGPIMLALNVAIQAALSILSSVQVPQCGL